MNMPEILLAAVSKLTCAKALTDALSSIDTGLYVDEACRFGIETKIEAIERLSAAAVSRTQEWSEARVGKKVGEGILLLKTGF